MFKVKVQTTVLTGKLECITDTLHSKRVTAFGLAMMHVSNNPRIAQYSDKFMQVNDNDSFSF